MKNYNYDDFLILLERENWKYDSALDHIADYVDSVLGYV